MESQKMVQDVEVDRCSECEGLWLDHGELREILQERISERANPRDMGGADRSDRRCPDCDRELFQRPFPETTVRVDQCIHCAGIFLDEGELQSIKKAITG